MVSFDFLIEIRVQPSQCLVHTCEERLSGAAAGFQVGRSTSGSQMLDLREKTGNDPEKTFVGRWQTLNANGTSLR